MPRKVLTEEERKAKQKEKDHKRYERLKDDPSYRARKKAASQRHYETHKDTEEYKRKAQIAYEKHLEKLCTDEMYRANINAKKLARFHNKYGLDPEYRARAAERSRAYHEEHKDDPDFKEKARIRKKQSYERMKKECPERFLLADSKRRAVELNAFVDWADEEVIEEFYKESKALLEKTGEPHEVDHIIPLQHKDGLVCGLHNEFNLQVLTRTKNRAKRHYWCIECQGWPCECVTIKES